jgi:hypothetical protein
VCCSAARHVRLRFHHARFLRLAGIVYRVIEAGFDGMMWFYRRTLDIVLRHQRITLGGARMRRREVIR